MNTNSTYYDFGYNIVGPFLYGFVKWLIEKTKFMSAQKLLFLARDGYMIQNIYEELVDESEMISHSYFYCSRKSLRNALMWQFDNYEDSLKYVNKMKTISIGYMLEYYGFSYEEGVCARERLNIECDYSIPYKELNNCECYKLLYDTYKENIVNKSKEQDRLFFGYLNQIEIAERTAIVDAGWHGSMQYYLEEYFSLHDIDVLLIGMYVGIYSFYKLKGDKCGYLFETGEDKNRKRVMCFHGVLEKLLQSGEGSTCYYRWMDGKVVPHNLEYEYSNDFVVQKCIAEWQRGVVVAVEHLKDDKTIKQYDVYAKKLVRFGMYPSLDDIEVFKFMYNFDGEKYYYTAQNDVRWFKINEIKNGLLHSPWKTGYMKSVFKLPLPYYWIYKLVS